MRENEAAERDRIDQIARSWLGTPFHDNACVKGAGTDCAQLLRGVFVESGLVPKFETEIYRPQHFLHQKEERFLAWVTRFAHEIAPDQVKHGDVVLYHVGHVFAHGAIVVTPGWPNIVHAHYAVRRVIRANGCNPHLGTPVKAMKFFSIW